MDKLVRTVPLSVFTAGSAISTFIAEQPYQKEIAYVVLLLSFLLIVRKAVIYAVADGLKQWKRIKKFYENHQS